MRVISGCWRGRTLIAPRGVRATTDRVKEALFSILDSPQDLSVLDLFAGSGALGIEALSRGAASAVFVDRARQAAQTITANLPDLGSQSVQVLQQEAYSFLRKATVAFDWIFCDPPYDQVNYGILLHAFIKSNALSERTLLILESDRFHEIPIPESLRCEDWRRFGDTLIHFITRA